MPAVVKWSPYAKYAGRLMTRVDYAPKVAVGVSEVVVSVLVQYQSYNTGTKNFSTSISGAISGSHAATVACPQGHLVTLAKFQARFPILEGQTQSIKIYATTTVTDPNNKYQSVPSTVTIPPFLCENVLPQKKLPKPNRPGTKKPKKGTSKPGGNDWLETGKTLPKIYNALEWAAIMGQGAPAERFILEKRVDGGKGGSSWTWVGSSSETTWTDTNVEQGHKYEYRVHGENSGGSSEYAYFDPVYTAPLRPLWLHASRTGTDVTLWWTNQAVGDYLTRVYRDGELDKTVGEVAKDIGSIVLHDVPADKPLTLAVRHFALQKNDPATGGGSSPATGGNTPATVGGSSPATGGGGTTTQPTVEEVTGILSEWLEIPAAAPPLPPDMLDPSDGWVMPTTPSVRVSWRHNPSDMSTQTGYVLEVKDHNSDEWIKLDPVKSVDSWHDLTQADIDFTLVKTIDWRVSTSGVLADVYGEPSEIGTIHMDQVATSRVVSPVKDTTVTSPVVEVECETNATVPFVWRVDLWRDGKLVAQVDGRNVDGKKFSARFDGLKDASLYEIRPYVGSVNLLEGIVSSFTTGFAVVEAPAVTCEWDSDRGTTYLRIVNTKSHVANIEVARLVGKVWVPIYHDLPLNAAVTDYTPPVLEKLQYRVTAKDDAGNVSYGYAMVAPRVRNVYLSSRDGQIWACLKWNPEHTRTSGLANIQKQYFLGRSTPVLMTGEETVRTVSLSGVIVGDDEKDLARWDTVSTYGRPLFYRDPTGLCMWVGVSDVNLQRERASRLWTVSFTGTQVAAPGGDK